MVCLDVSRKRADRYTECLLYFSVIRSMPINNKNNHPDNLTMYELGNWNIKSFGHSSSIKGLCLLGGIVNDVSYNIYVL